MSLRIAHVMAGAPMGGAEAFFERLTTAQQAAGEQVLAVIRTDAGRAPRRRRIDRPARHRSGPGPPCRARRWRPASPPPG